MTDLKTINFEIPHLWQIEWEQVISDAADTGTKMILINQARSANMLKNINDFEASPERVAWLSIWTKTYSALNGALAALSHRSSFLLKIISRSVLESWLQIDIIYEPVSNLFKLKSSHKNITITKNTRKLVFKQSIERLRAYTAWCLWNDKQLCKELLYPGNLNELWDSEPATQIMTDKKKLDLHEKIYGTLNIDIDKKVLCEQRNMMENHINTNMHLLSNWLEGSLLKDWHKKIENLAQINNGNVPFFQLFDEKDYSIPKRLRKMDSRFAYAIYKEGSIIIHGSTANQMLSINDNKIIPLYLGSPKECNAHALFVADFCANILWHLEILKRVLWDINSL